MNEQIEKWLSQKKAELAKQQAKEKAEYLEKVGVIHKKWFESEKDINKAGLKLEDVVKLSYPTQNGKYYAYDINPDSITDEEYQAIVALAGKDAATKDAEKKEKAKLKELYENVASIKKMMIFFTVIAAIGLLISIIVGTSAGIS